MSRGARNDAPSRFLVAVLSLIFVSCRPLAPSTPTPMGGIRVTHIEGREWRVDYTLSAPTSSLAFKGPPFAFRHDWRPLGGTRLVTTEQADVLVAESATSAFSVLVTATDEQPDKDYRPFYAFTDQGALVFPAHFAVETPGAAPTTLVASTKTAETVLVHGHPRAAEVTLSSKEAYTYAYFGMLPAVETPEFIGITDRGFPPVLRSRLDRLLAPLFELYANELGRALPGTEKPLLFATFGASDHHDVGGGVIHPRVVSFAFNLNPDELRALDETLLESLDLIAAHEIAHLWNADLYSHPGARSVDWMHEGSADALAYRALRRLGSLSEEAYRVHLSTSASLCALALAEGRPLSGGSSRDMYECGSTIALVTEGAVKTRDPSMTLFSFWKAVFASTRDGAYDDDLYHTTLARLGGDPTTSDFIRRLTRDRLTDPTSEIEHALLRVGVELEAVASPLPLAYEAHASPMAVRALLPEACAASLQFRGNYAALPHVTRDHACGEAARDDVLTTLAGVDLGMRGASAFDAGFAQCAKNHDIEVGRRGKPSIRISCAPHPRRRPPYLAIRRAPAR